MKKTNGCCVCGREIHTATMSSKPYDPKKHTCNIVWCKELQASVCFSCLIKFALKHGFADEVKYEPNNKPPQFMLGA